MTDPAAMSSPAEPGPPLFSRESVMTWPNFITLVRLLCIPVFVWLLFGREHRAAAAWLLGILGSTDWVDGWVARRFDQTSEFGRLFDPTVDRLMFLVAIPSIVIDGSMALWLAVAILAREVILAGIAITLQSKGIEAMDVTWEGKTGAFLLMFAIPMFLGAESTLSYAPVLQWLAWIFVAPGLAYSWYSLIAQYVPEARKRLRQARQVSSQP